MDFKHGGVPLSATKAAPSPPEVYPKVSLSTSSGSSFPIRAPPTVDSDIESSVSTNGHENQNSSSGSDSGFESDGFVSGEDEFDTASERPSFADPDDETLEETHVVEQNVVSSPFVTNPYGESREESSSFKDYAFSRPFATDPRGETRGESGCTEDSSVSRPFVIDTDDETSATYMEEEEEYFGELAVVGIGKVGVPKAILSRDSDDDSLGTEEGDDDGFSGVVRIPDINIIGRADSSIEVQGLGVEGEEEDESYFEPALEAEVEGFIGVKDPVVDNVSASSESVKDEVPGEAEGVVESLMATEDEFLCENSEKSRIVFHSGGEIQVLENMEQQESQSMTEVTMNFQNSERRGDGDSERGNRGWGSDGEKTEGITEKSFDLGVGVDLRDFIACGTVELVDSVTAENGIRNTDTNVNSEPHSVEETKCYGSGLSLKPSEDSEVEVKAEVEGESSHDCGSNGEKTEVITEERFDLGVDSCDFIACGTVELVDNVTAENGIRITDTSINLEPLSVQETKCHGSGLSLKPSEDPEVEVKAEVEGESGHDCGSNGEKMEGITEERFDLGVDSRDFIACGTVELVDNVTAENGIRITDTSINSEPLSVQETKCYGSGLSLKPSEDPEVEVKAEVKGESGHDCGSDGEKMEGITEERLDLGVDSHDFIACSTVERVDSVNAENGIRSTDTNRNLEPLSVQETKCYGSGLALKPSEDNVMEDGLRTYQQSNGSNLDPEVEVKAEVEGESGHDSETSEEGSFAEDDFRGLVVGASDKTMLVMDSVERSLTPTSLGESSMDLLPRTERPMIAESYDEVHANEESKGKEPFDSSVLAALLKAASGGASGGGSFTVTTANSSRVVSFEQPTGNSELTDGFAGESDETLSEEEKKKIDKMQMIRVKFLRLVHRLGLSYEDSIASQVLYRLVIAAGRPTSQSFSLEFTKRRAMQLEAEGKDDLDFPLNILVLGKTGVGKSATVNSIFGEKKAVVNAFEPGTTSVKHIVGTINGIRCRIFDTPGLRSSLLEQSFNRKILLSIRKLTKKFPPDVVLYVDRLDTQTKDLNDLPLLRSITSSLGSAIWDNSIITLTHAASNPPDGPTGSPLSYDLFVAQRSRVIHQLISQAVGDPRLMSPSLMSPVSLVENQGGQILLPNGETWRPQLLLLCYAVKILSEANSVTKTHDLFDHRKLFGFRTPSPPLTYLLSSLLQSNAHPKLPNEQSGDNVDYDTELGDFSASGQEDEDEYEYDKLPAFNPLNKAQIAKLSKEHRKAYFEEYDYRVRLLLKKQLREEMKRLRELKKRGKDGQNNYDGYAEDGEEESGSPSAVEVPLPDMALPPSFDGENPAYRYRFLEPTSHLISRPVMDSHGWDHDCGYDGISLESNLAIAGRLPSVIAVQITKDKKDFNIQLDSSVAMKHGESGSTMAGLDIQNVGKQIAYILKGETKFKLLKTNKTSAGVAVTFLGENVATGVKIEDQVAIGKRLVLVGSSGIIRSQGDSACGGNLEFRLREKDFPIGQDQTTANLSLVRWRGEVIWAGNLQSQLSIGRSSKVVFQAGLNSKSTGQVSVKISSSDELQIALFGILPIASAIFRNFFPGFSDKYMNQ